MPATDPNLNALVEAHTGFVHALALRLAPAAGLAEDIAQQVLFEFLAKAPQWDLAQDLKPLLAGMTRMVARRCWREQTRAMPEHLRQLAEHIRDLAAATEDTNWHGEEERQALRQCLETLPDKSKRLIELHYYLDLTSVAIARQLEVKADAVRRALFRLREQLRKCIQRALARS